jgi:phage terminase small subunit
MGRNAKPIQLHLVDGNPNRLTKRQIADRKSSEIKIGEKKLRPPDFIKADPVALKKFREVVRLYSDIDFITSADACIIGRYCKTFSEYVRAVAERDNYLLGDIDDTKKLDDAVNKKNELMTRLEDRIFLNALSRVKNVPKKEKKKEVSPLERAGFGNV